MISLKKLLYYIIIFLKIPLTFKTDGNKYGIWYNNDIYPLNDLYKLDYTRSNITPSTNGTYTWTWTGLKSQNYLLIGYVNGEISSTAWDTTGWYIKNISVSGGTFSTIAGNTSNTPFVVGKITNVTGTSITVTATHNRPQIDKSAYYYLYTINPWEL